MFKVQEYSYSFCRSAVTLDDNTFTLVKKKNSESRMHIHLTFDLIYFIHCNNFKINILAKLFHKITQQQTKKSSENINRRNTEKARIW